MAWAASFALATQTPRRAAATESPADVIFRNGPIHPLSGPGEGQVDALATGGGTILAAGALDKVMALAGPGMQIVDLGGRTVLPGLIDPHNHTVLTSLFGALLTNVGHARHKTKAEAVAAMKATAAKTTPGAWMTFGFFDNILQGGDFSMAEPDAFSTTGPIFLLSVNGHVGAANSLAFTQAKARRPRATCRAAGSTAMAPTAS